jgi:hypothetical protein
MSLLPAMLSSLSPPKGSTCCQVGEGDKVGGGKPTTGATVCVVDVCRRVARGRAVDAFDTLVTVARHSVTVVVCKLSTSSEKPEAMATTYHWLP